MKTTLRTFDRSTPAGRLARRAASAALTLLVAAAAAFAASLIARADDSTPAPTTSSGIPCDPDGVTVGYDVRYASSLASYAVSGLRVVGIASACSGSTIRVALADGSGAELADGTISATVAGPTVHQALTGAVAAAAVQTVYVSLQGRTEVLDATGLTPTPETTTTTPTPAPVLALAPSLCPTISGAVSVVGLPQECGSVAATQSLSAAAAKPTPVASWPAQVFPEKVRVTLEMPSATVLPLVRVAAGSTIVQLSVIRESTGEPITQWEGVMAIDFPAQAGSFLAAYSHDGTTWESIPQLDGPDLPAGRPDGYFVNSDRTVTLYTRHATFFALAEPPRPIADVHAKLLPTGDVRVTWTPSEAGLGVSSYWVVRDGKVAAKVDGEHTIAFLRGLRRSTFGLRLIAVDPVGARSDSSPTIRVRVPLLVGAQLEATKPVVRAHVRLTARASLRVLLLAANGRKLKLLPGSTIAGRPLGAAVDAPGRYALSLRLDPRALRPGARYRVVVVAHPERGADDRAELRFRG